MKKLLFLIYLLTHFTLSHANNSLALKYDFKTGDEFVVKVRSYGQGYNKSLFAAGFSINTLNPSSVDFFFEFKPTGKSKKLTEMEVVIRRIVRWHNNRCYDTQIPNSAIDSYEKNVQ